MSKVGLNYSGNFVGLKQISAGVSPNSQSPFSKSRQYSFLFSQDMLVVDSNK